MSKVIEVSIHRVDNLAKSAGQAKIDSFANRETKWGNKKRASSDLHHPRVDGHFNTYACGSASHTC